jgi:hypothetical protein
MNSKRFVGMDRAKGQLGLVGLCSQEHLDCATTSKRAGLQRVLGKKRRSRRGQL